MADTDSGAKAASSAQQQQPAKPAKDFGSTHRVKKLLDTYLGTAGQTLTGPANSSLEDAATTRYKGGVGPPTGAPPVPVAAAAAAAAAAAIHYKLPPDVELSKTSGHPDDDAEEEAAFVRSKQRAAEEYYREKVAHVDRQQVGYSTSASSAHLHHHEVAEKVNNGLVTLSR